MGKFPAWRATHKITSTKGVWIVMRLFPQQDNVSFAESPEVGFRPMPQFYTEDWIRVYPSAGRKFEVMPGVVIPSFAKNPAQAAAVKANRHAANKINFHMNAPPPVDQAAPIVESHGATESVSPAVLSEPPLAGGGNAVILSSNCAACVYAAASLPEWTCSCGQAQASTGDTATVIDFDKARNVKRVRVYNIHPTTKQGGMHDVLVRGTTDFELW